MINLIPTTAKKKILIEYWVRVITVWMFLWSFIIVLSLVIFVPTYVLVNSQEKVYRASAAEASTEVDNYEAVAKSLNRTSKQARFIIDSAEDDLLSSYIILFKSLQNSNIELSQISINKNDEGLDPIRLAGVAEDRQALASFRDRLLEETLVESVDLPISNLASEEEIKFNITIETNKQKEI